MTQFHSAKTSWTLQVVLHRNLFATNALNIFTLDYPPLQGWDSKTNQVQFTFADFFSNCLVDSLVIGELDKPGTTVDKSWTDLICIYKFTVYWLFCWHQRPQPSSNRIFESATHVNRSLDLLLGIESLPNLFWRELRKPSFKGCGPWHRVLIYKEIIVIIKEPLNIFLFWERDRVNRCNTHQNSGSTNTKRNLTLLPWSCAVLRVLVRPLRRSTPLW